MQIQGNGHGNPEKSTGPPSPASASRSDMITAIAASSLPSVVAVLCEFGTDGGVEAAGGGGMEAVLEHSFHDRGTFEAARGDWAREARVAHRQRARRRRRGGEDVLRRDHQRNDCPRYRADGRRAAAGCRRRS